jgi:Tfp pilus assembly protein FimT
MGCKQQAKQSGGFTLLELICAIAGMALLLGMIAPNLTSLLPTARLDGSAKSIMAKLQMVRSEARIQAKRMEVEFDLEVGRYRVIPPPEEQLTSDQILYDDERTEDEQKDWIDLDSNVNFAGAGDAKTGVIEKGMYRVVFDEYGFTADQVVAVTLESDETMIWSVVIRGLTGKVEVVKSEEGELAKPSLVGEGAF